MQARVNAAPVEGAANKALVKLIADALRIAPSHITIVSGQQSRHKRISIEGLDGDHVREKILGNSSRNRD
jgi:uncharacterized protein (TIGR00251 family)